MSVGILTLVVLALALIGYVLARRRAVAAADGDARNLHSRTGYYGQLVFLFTSVPALLVMLVWLFLQPIIIENAVSSQIPDTAIPESGELSLVMSDVRRIAGGIDRLMQAEGINEDQLEIMTAEGGDMRARLGAVGVALGGEVHGDVFTAAKAYRQSQQTGTMAMSVVVIVLAAGFLAVSLSRIHKDLRARNISEAFVLTLLIGASLVAILTTIGIVLSLLFETYNFFQLYPWQDYFLSTTWNPQFTGGSDLGFIPLVWGTLYVSLVALIVSVPIGLMIAIYLAEYAGKKTRSIAKPAIEVLAGIPTIVYGLFALITIGPFIRDWIAQPTGLGDSSSSVLTAGLVMGIMLIPFVSSLSDDIINAVPQSLRDGSYGLGATQSETVKQVILPAALPGVVGAILLAASRAIGETMIVVMGAGAAAKMSLNPLEAMTTVTVKIVSQLTGDTEFASPETLVAFALGLTLFLFTLCLNVLALIIVRKYREQYE
ncbi:phosphate ABC transporter permease subunit PstC [Alisedimentitalea sp. MJ-SS2]|uniref:phosphate ABC transporter permease subunit PstC n=1 Tax=Aliisedimentitalea sp. MJ-SS2 TaxID=3049795 RepID=UPI00290B8D50|nr:phosphate ABC transporter permease subunit PstC [Alisedimentitalea sp. MJ-SS2]MDU8926929.1 phosphate ABC transporter permease subunit PstC [Alisedimentitalea sp. MJ-SS2]